VEVRGRAPKPAIELDRIRLLRQLQGFFFPMSEVDTKTNGNGNTNQNQTGEAVQGPNLVAKYSPSSPELSLRSFRDEAEIFAISGALRQTGWNRKRAARLLSISYRGLLYKIRRHNIAPPVELS
jgi:transcriptional regulator with GAF, ATPase, and Fis domain